MKHFISLQDITPEQFDDLLSLTAKLKSETKAKVPHRTLQGKSLGMIFSKSSTRTRVSFEVGMYQLGGQALFLSSQDIQLGRGETIEDTAKVLSRFLDAVMIRTYDHQDILDMARHSSIPIINGLSDLLHPCQALADLFTVLEHFGTLRGLKLAYTGDGNNVANSLLFACALAGMQIAVATPPGFECDAQCVAAAERIARTTHASITLTREPALACEGADVVYTDTWISMGQEDQKSEKIPRFMPYQVNDALMGKASEGAIFLHCLPAYRGFEVTTDVIDGDQSRVFDQAENRLHAQKAVLVTLMKD